MPRSLLRAVTAWVDEQRERLAREPDGCDLGDYVSTLEMARGIAMPSLELLSAAKKLERGIAARAAAAPSVTARDN